MNKIFDKIKSFFISNKEIVTPTAVLAIICVVVTLALSSANLLTHKKIDDLKIASQKEAMTKVMTGDYEEKTTTISDQKVTYHVVKQNNAVVGYIFTTSAKGYGGTVEVMTAVKPDGTVAAVEILDASGETPGLGQNVTNPDWYKQFDGLKNGVTVIKGGTADNANNEVDAVTGATISSKAVTAAVNQALGYANEIIAKGDALK